MTTIRFLYRTISPEGNPVNGHRQRMATLSAHFAADTVRLGIPKYNERWGDVIVCDGMYDNHIPDSAKIVFVDSGRMDYSREVTRIDLYINPDMGACEVPKVAMSSMLGLNFSIVSDIERLPSSDQSVDVFLAPGGNEKIFWDKVKNSSRLTQCIGTNMPHSEFLSAMAGAKVVVTTPSVAMIEAMTMGKLVYLVRTSTDQTTNMEYAISRQFARTFVSWDKIDTEDTLHMGARAKEHTKPAMYGASLVARAIRGLI